MENIPVVEVSDLKVMWAHRHEGYGWTAYHSLFNPTSNAFALGYRCTVLQHLSTLWVGGEPSPVAFEAASTMDLTSPLIGEIQSEPLFSLDKLLAETMVLQNKAGL